MKKLNQFLVFDWQSFCKGKRFMVLGTKQWKDFDTDNVVGTKIEAIIIEDNTKYVLSEGERVSNLYEKLTIKVPHIIDNLPLNVEVQFQQVTASVYGEFRNQLSVTADNVLLVNQKEK